MCRFATEFCNLLFYRGIVFFLPFSSGVLAIITMQKQWQHLSLAVQLISLAVKSWAPGFFYSQISRTASVNATTVRAKKSKKLPLWRTVPSGKAGQTLKLQPTRVLAASSCYLLCRPLRPCLVPFRKPKIFFEVILLI